MNRKRSSKEVALADSISNNNSICSLIDAFRYKHKTDGYSWYRGACYSRLDHVFVSENITRYISKAENIWNVEKSDHAAVKIGFKLPNEPKQGKGIIKINMKLVESKMEFSRIEAEIRDKLTQVPQEWDPHMKLEFLKMTVRTVFSYRTGVIRKEITEEIGDLEKAMNNIEMIKVKFLTNNRDPNAAGYENRLSSIDKARDKIKTELELLRKKNDKELQFRSKVKWFEYGERSNSFFLNLNKWWVKRKAIFEITSNGNLFKGSGVIVGIREFYNKLYTKCDPKIMINNTDADYYKECPKLSIDAKERLDMRLTKEELRSALHTCKESAPGPDGIPYLFYKKFWHIVGDIITDAWYFSVEIGKMPPSHLESVITVLPKEGKDLKDIKNWRPITLTNCDAKIVTKALAGRMAKVMDSVIDTNQTAYVPGRSVMDNIRCNMFLKKHCERRKVDAVLISLDAKKAFDSVDHNYIRKTLENYGFGPVFISYFNTLYNDITARVLVNGFFSETIKIERGVKQGDALSCAIFILCIDPLLRNLNANKKIKSIALETKITKKSCLP